MYKEQIVGLAVRLFAIFLFLYAVRHTSGLLIFVSEQPQNNVNELLIFAPLLFSIIAAILLWHFPLTVATKIIPDIKSKNKAPALNAAEIEVVAFSVMGLWVLATAIPDVFYWAIFVLRLKSIELANVTLADSIGNIIATAVELVIGVWLLFGSRGILGLIRGLRKA
jgi:hypothetical protein